MAVARLDGSAIIDWDSFHTACEKEFGFPGFYGRNGNAWIDCMSYIDEDNGMTRFALQPAESLLIEVSDSDGLRRRAPEILEELIELTAAVNERFVESEGRPKLELSLL